MPAYPYKCKNCDHAFEVVQSFSDDALTECSQCGGPLRKIYSSVGVVFKGSGFYRNDSRAGANGGAGGDSGASGSAAGAGDSSSSSSSSSGDSAKPSGDSTPVNSATT